MRHGQQTNHHPTLRLVEVCVSGWVVMALGWRKTDGFPAPCLQVAECRAHRWEGGRA